MIELVIADRCIGCNLCVAVCPGNVFETIPDRPPRIARQSDCQTCFLCELYCKSDSLYVHPDCDAAHPQDEATILHSGLLGQYRRDSGWDEWNADPSLVDQHWRMEEVFVRARGLS